MKKMGTKEKILKEGQSLLQSYGYHGFSFQDIADRIDLKKPSLYDHFASKEELVLAILTSYKKRLMDWAQEQENQKSLTNIKSLFRVFYEWSCDHHKVCPVLALMTDMSILNSPVRQSMNDFIAVWMKWLENEIKKGQRLGEIKADLNARQVSEQVYSQLMGAQIQARIFNQPEITLKAADFICDFLKTKPNREPKKNKKNAG